MHSTIYQVSQEPIDPGAYIDEHFLDVDDPFFRNIASYTAADEYREASVSAFLEVVTHQNPYIVVDGESFLLREGHLEAYFAGRYEAFQDAARELADISLESFAHGQASAQAYELKQLEEDEYGFYVYVPEADSLMTLDAFLREAECETQYFIGGTVDYKF